MATREELEAELARLSHEEREAAWASRTCRVCGEQDEGYGGTKGYLTSFELRVAFGEEGHSVIDSWLCELDLPTVTDALAEAGIVLHAHGGICFLEDQNCEGARDMDACPTPEAQYPE